MNPPRKKIWTAFALLVAVLGAWWFFSPGTPAPQIVTMPDGGKYQFMGVTYGQHHYMGPVILQWLARAPAPVSSFVSKHLGTRLGQLHICETDEAEPCLCVWFRPLGTNAAAPSGGPFVTNWLGVSGRVLGDAQAMVDDNYALSDDQGIKAGTTAGYIYIPPRNEGWIVQAFKVVPRRSRQIQLHLSQASIYDPAPLEFAVVKFANPLYGNFPQWKPDSLPLVREVGGVRVRLDNFLSGVTSSSMMSTFLTRVGVRAPPPPPTNTFALASDYRPAHNEENAKFVFETSISSLPGYTGHWELQGAELSDATGNRLHTGPRPTDYRNVIDGTLWPDESAWRLRLKLKWQPTNAAANLVTFKNVPVPRSGTTIHPSLTNTVAGVKIVLTEVAFEPGGAFAEWYQPGDCRIHFACSGSEDQLDLDSVSLITDTGAQPKYDYGSGGTDGRGEFQREMAFHSFPTNAATMDITLAIQKTRSVDFLVKPPGSK